jgi:transposase
MRKRQTFTSMQWKEIKRKIAKLSVKSVDAKGYKRLLALHMRGLGKTNVEVGELLGYSPCHVTVLVSKYKKDGMDAILIDKRTSNNRRMDFSEEASFLEQFEELAEAGQVLTVEKILLKYQETTGKESNTSTIYKLLKRHGWRKVKPRPKHPNGATEAEKEVSKKLRKISGKSYWKKIEETNEINSNNSNVQG